MTNNDTGATGRAQQRIEELAEEYIQKWWTKREHKGAARLGFKAGYTAAKAATPDSREEGKGEYTLEDMRAAWSKGVEWGDANCEFAGETRLPKFPEWISNYRPVPPAPVSDAVEFAEWIVRNCHYHNSGWIWATGDCNYYTNAELYTIFLTQKQKV